MTNLTIHLTSAWFLNSTNKPYKLTLVSNILRLVLILVEIYIAQILQSCNTRSINNGSHFKSIYQTMKKLIKIKIFKEENTGRKHCIYYYCFYSFKNNKWNLFVGALNLFLRYLSLILRYACNLRLLSRLPTDYNAILWSASCSLRTPIDFYSFV